MTATAAVAAILPRALAYRPFLDPLPVWRYWIWLLIPLCAAVAIVYKCIRCRRVSRIPVEAAKTTAWILAGMATAAAVLWVIVWAVERE